MLTPAFDRQRARFLLVLGDEVAVRVGPVTQFPDGVVVRDNKSLEAPLLAQHIAQQPLVGVRWNAIDLVVRGHQRHCSGFAQRFLEGVEEGLLQHAHRDVCRRAVHARLRLPVSDKVLQRRQHMPLVLEVCVALEAAHRRDAQPRNQVGIFAVGLFDAAPARLARHIHHRSERMMRAAQPRFKSRHRE